MTDRMTGDELRARREYLGITGDLLADYLGNRSDTLRRWEGGRDPVPHGLRDQIARIERETTEQVEDLAFTLAQVAREPMGDGWEMHVLDDRRQPVIRALGARWWRHVVVRAAEQYPDVDISGLLVMPAHWRRPPRGA